MAADPPSSADDPLLAAYLERRANLVRFLAARAGSLAAAEDLAQELYLKLAGRDRGEAVGNPTAMLYKMALNLLLDRARGEARSAAASRWPTSRPPTRPPPPPSACASWSPPSRTCRPRPAARFACTSWRA